MRALIVTYEDPLVRNTGDSIYTANLVDALYSMACEVDVVYYGSNQDEGKLTKPSDLFVRRFCVPFSKKSFLAFVFSLMPSVHVNRYSIEYMAVLMDAVEMFEYDFVFVNHFKMAFVIPLIKSKLSKRTRLVYVAHNVEYLLNLNLSRCGSIFSKLVYLVEAIKTRSKEHAYLNMCDAVTAISENDADALRDLYLLSNVHIMRPVMQYLDHSDSSERSWSNVIIAGSFQWFPKLLNLKNFLAATNFNKLIKSGIKVFVVGRADEKVVSEVNAAYHNVQMTGGVASLLPYYSQARIAVVPEKLGGGFKLKVAEAALNKTLIVSIVGAITRCGFVPGKHYIECPTYESMVDVLLELQSPDRQREANQMIRESYDLAASLYSLPAIVSTIKELVTGVCKKD